MEKDKNYGILVDGIIKPGLSEEKARQEVDELNEKKKDAVLLRKKGMGGWEQAIE